MKSPARLLATAFAFAVLWCSPYAFAQKQPAPSTQSQAQPAAPATPDAQPGREPPAANAELSARLDEMSATLTEIESTLRTSRPNQAALDQMRLSIKPILDRSQAIVDRLTPAIAALKARVDQLGPKPAAGAPPEAADIAKERVTAQAAFDGADALMKRAMLISTEAKQDDGFLAVRQRAVFNHDLFQRETSVAYPPLWLTVVSETPGNLSRIFETFGDWARSFYSNLGGVRLVMFIGGAIVLVLAFGPIMWIASRLLRRDPAIVEPSRWRKILVACWISLTLPAVIIGLMYGLAFLSTFVEVPNTRLQPLFSAVQNGVVRIALALGLARGILAPESSVWRLSRLDDETCNKLIRIIVAVAIILTCSRVIEAINEVIYASTSFSIASRGIGALLIAAALAAALFSLSDGPEDEKEQSPAEVHTEPPREWAGLIRGAAWTLVILMIVAALAGYITFAQFLVAQIVLVAATGAIFYLAANFADEAFAVGFHPTGVLGKSLIYSVGLRREGLDQVSILLSGLTRLILIVIAALVVMVPWGLQSTDIPSNLYAIFFGFKVGEITISLAGIALAFLIFLAVIGATRAVQGWLETRYLPLTRLDAGLQNSIKISLGYAGFILALAAAAADLGVDFQKLAIVAGALSVGIGFGLQSIVNNFVSGLIILWERAVRVGDWIVVGSDQGYVRRINVRSTEIETFDRASVIIPNSNLVSGIVKNLMRTDRMGRLMIEVTVHSMANPDDVRDSLLALARAHEAVLMSPAPQVRFTNLTASSMNFDLYCFVGDVDGVMRVKSELYFEIHREFAEKGFFNGPAPDPLSIKIDGLDRLESMLQKRAASAKTSASKSATAAPPAAGASAAPRNSSS